MAEVSRPMQRCPFLPIGHVDGYPELDRRFYAACTALRCSEMDQRPSALITPLNSMAHSFR
jgi:hypothetical protein